MRIIKIAAAVILVYGLVTLLAYLADKFPRSQSARVTRSIYQQGGDDRCRAISWRSAPKGVILEIECSSPVRSVIRKVKPGVVAPVPFILVPTERDNVFMLLVDYPFDPHEELYLALITDDLHTWSMSPYFPAQPDATDAEYDALVRSPLAERYTKEESLAILRRIAPRLPSKDLDPQWE